MAVEFQFDKLFRFSKSDVVHKPILGYDTSISAVKCNTIYCINENILRTIFIARR